MRSRLGTLLASAVSLAPLVVPRPAHSQWVPNGVPLCRAFGEQGHPRATSDGVGGAIVVWRDYRAPRPREDSDVYAQRVTRDGRIPPGWPADGVPVCTDSASQDHTAIAADGSGGAYIVWMDRRDYFTRGTDLYIQRLTADGGIAPGWAVNGIPLCTAPGDQWLPRITSGGLGGAIVAWADFRRSGVLFGEPADIYAQRVLGDGTIAPGWPADGLAVCTAPGYREDANLVADEQGGALIVWVDGRDLAVTAWDIYALRITAEGSIAPGWVPDGVPVCTARGYQYWPRMVPDGTGGLVVAWTDLRSAPPGDELNDDYSDIYAQRVLASGAIAPGWPPDGIPLCTAPRIQWTPAIAADGTGGAIVAWSDYRNYFPNASDLYAQRVLGTGAIAPGWPADGAALSRLSGWQIDPVAASDGLGGAFVAFERFTPGNEVYAQHVSGTGVIAPGWPADGIPLVSVRGGQFDPFIIGADGMDAIVVWDEQRFVEGQIKDPDIYAQRLVGDGPVPVQLGLVSAVAEPDRVVLTWYGAEAAGLAATVYRRTSTTDWQGLGSPTSDGSGRLTYVDRDVTPGARYAYRLGYIQGGVEAFTAEVWLDIPTQLALALEGMRPNPAVREAMICFTLPSAEPAMLELLDLSGRLVLQREVGSLGPGRHLVRLDQGDRLPAGIYWLRLGQSERSLVARAVVVR